MRSGIFLVVRKLDGVPTSKFAFQLIPALDHYGVDVARDDILQNFIGKDDQLMNGGTPWRGPREKSMLFMQMLIQASSLPNDVVLDCIVGTCMHSTVDYIWLFFIHLYIVYHFLL